jgi:hypothetical protein
MIPQRCIEISVPEDWRCFGQSPKTWVALDRARRLEVFWTEPEDLLETEVAVAEGGRDTRVLGDPMDLIRCQNYLAEPTVTKRYTQHRPGAFRLVSKIT